MYKGSVLIDNTTIHGAKFAYEAWPLSANDWLNGPNSVNLRSLMDILESIVLYDNILVDGACRLILADGGFEPIWPELERQYGHSIFDTVSFSYDEEIPLQILLNTSLDKVKYYLSTSQFKDNLLYFKNRNIDFVVPEFYRSAEDFESKLLMSFPKERLTNNIINKFTE